MYSKEDYGVRMSVIIENFSVWIWYGACYHPDSQLIQLSIYNLDNVSVIAEQAEVFSIFSTIDWWNISCA